MFEEEEEECGMRLGNCLSVSVAAFIIRAPFVWEHVLHERRFRFCVLSGIRYARKHTTPFQWFTIVYVTIKSYRGEHSSHSKDLTPLVI